MHDEFNLANAAVPELDVVLEIPPLHFALDHGLHLAQRFEHTEIQITSIDEGADQLGEQLLVGRCVGHGARLDPGIALPVATVNLQIIFQRGRVRDHRPAVAEGAQAQIDAEDEAVFGLLFQQPDELLHEAGEELLVADRSRAIGLAAFGVHRHEVDIGGEIEFAAAELAHGDDDESLFGARVGARLAIAALERAPGELFGQLQCALGRAR